MIKTRIAGTAALFTFGLAALGGTVVAVAAPAYATPGSSGSSSPLGPSGPSSGSNPSSPSNPSSRTDPGSIRPSSEQKPPTFGDKSLAMAATHQMLREETESKLRLHELNQANRG